MSGTLLRGTLRGLAVAIAIAALIDPVLSSDRTPPAPIVLIDMTSADVAPIEQALERLSGGAGIDTREVSGHRLPCADGERCVAVTDGSVDVDLPTDLSSRLSVIRAAAVAAPNVRMQSVRVMSAHHAGAAGVAQVQLEGLGVTGTRTEIRVTDGGAVVGTNTVDWTSDGSQSVDVPWWPMGPGPRSLRVDAVTNLDETARFDNAIDVGVDVADEPWPVLVFDARGSWASTFVRRALEDDRRFLVEHRARLAPAITTGTATGRLDQRALDAAAVLVVGGPDALTAADADLIDQFVRVRGGTAIVLPERLPAGPAARVMPGTWKERLVAEPHTLGALRATELLETDDAAAEPMVVRPAGRGRIVVATAMDAWRYRDVDGGVFDRFWQSAVAEGASAGARLRVSFEDRMAAPGSRQPFTVRFQSMSPVTIVEASAVARCGGEARALRLWPVGASGVFRGELPVGNDASCAVEATVNGVRASRGVAVKQAPSRAAGETIAALEQYARRGGGVVTDEDNLAAISGDNRRAPQPTPVWPMRSAWWMLPFAGCLSAEWWLRRRTGLR